jgi:hypothetical protein
MGYYALFMVKETIQKNNTRKKTSWILQYVGDYQRRIQLALDQLVKSGANPDNIVV